MSTYHTLGPQSRKLEHGAGWVPSDFCPCRLSSQAYHLHSLHLSILTSSHVLLVSCLCAVLSHSSRVRLFATPWTVAHQAPLSMGFPRQEYWSGVPLPSPWDWTQGSHKPTVWDVSNWESMKIMRESLYVSHWQVDSLGVLEMPAFSWGVQGMLGEGIHIWSRRVSSWAQRGIGLTWEAHQVQMFASNHRCRGHKCGFYSQAMESFWRV